MVDSCFTDRKIMFLGRYRCAPRFSAYRVKETGTIFSYIICPNYSSIQNISNMNDNKTNQRLRSANENKEREKTLDAYAKKK